MCRNRKLKAVCVATALLAMVLTAGCSKDIPASQSAETASQQGEQHKVDGKIEGQGSSDRTQKATMHLFTYFATKDGMYLQAEEFVVPATATPAHTAIEMLINGPQKNHELVTLMPVGVKLIALNVKDHVAYVDFNEAIMKNDNSGSATEMLLVGAIVNTLTEFQEVNKVQIMVNGKNITTLYGHMDLCEPLSRSEKIIKSK